MTEVWGRHPSQLACGTERTGVTAALWTHDSDESFEVDSRPVDEQHIVCLQLAPLKAAFWLDRELRYSGSYAAGDVSLVPAGYRAQAALQSKFRCLHLYIPAELLHRTIEEDHGRTKPQQLEIIDPKRQPDPLIERLGRGILGEVRNGLPLSRTRIDGLGLEIAVHLLRRYSNVSDLWTAKTQAFRAGLAPWQVRRCIEIFRADLSGDHSLEFIAAQVGLSTYHFARSFKQTTGLPPHAYLTKMRLELARTLLSDTNMRITDIALEVGYENSQSLARVFRKHFLCSPTEFRSLCRM